MNFLTDKYNGFCAACGGFNNFVPDSNQNSSWIIAGDSSFKTIRVSVDDVSRFLVGNIASVTGDVYLGNFKVTQVINPSGSRKGSIVLNTPFLVNSPTAKKDSSYTNGVVETSVHSVVNLTRFYPDVISYGAKLDSTKGHSQGGRDNDVYVENGALNINGIVPVTYQRFKKDDKKGTLSKIETEYLKTKAINCCDTIDGRAQRRNCKNYVEKKYSKLWDGVTLEVGTSVNSSGETTSTSETANESTVAQAARAGSSTGGNDGLASSVSGSSIVKYAFIGVALVGGFLLIRSIVKKQ